MKLVPITFNGRPYMCPDWAQFVAADKNGYIKAFEYRPKQSKTGVWSTGAPLGNQVQIGLTEPGKYDLTEIIIEGSTKWAMKILKAFRYEGSIVAECPSKFDYAKALEIIASEIDE